MGLSFGKTNLQVQILKSKIKKCTFALCIAMSDARSSSSARSVSELTLATPMLHVNITSRAPSSNGSPKVRSISWIRTETFGSSRLHSKSTVNSSAPMRASAPEFPTQSLSRRAISTRSRSPCRYPKLSLINLNRSMLMKIAV